MTLKVEKSQIVDALEQIATYLELRGENPFRIRVYNKAARVLRDLEQDIQPLIEEGRLTSIDGLGKSTAEKITELANTGKMSYLEELKSSFPDTLIKLLSIPGLGPKKVRALYEKLEIASLEQLEQACMENRLLTLDGFGEKTQQKILSGIAYIRKHRGRYLIHTAHEAAEAIKKSLRKMPEVLEIEVAGSLRRAKETVKDVDFVVSTEHPDVVMKAFVEHKLAVSVIAHGQTKSSITLDNGLNIDLRTVEPSQFAYVLMHFTGSKEHNTVMRSRAKERDLKLNEYGLFRGEERISADSETEIYRLLDLHFIPPELREDRGEFALAEEDEVPEMVTVKDLRGTFHAHTTYSDGRHTLEEMAKAAAKLKLDYLGITDHSRSAFYAGGLNLDEIEAQHAEIDALNEGGKGAWLFKGIESDILADGQLDYPDEVLQSFDFIIASVHSRFKMPKHEMTDRIIRAIEHPATTMLGHPTGRLLLSREGYALDMYKVIDAAVANGVIIEINANPYRLDIDWRLLSYGREKGLKISINPDAHTTDGLRHVQYGVGIARKGGLLASDVFNTLPLDEVKAHLKV